LRKSKKNLAQQLLNGRRFNFCNILFALMILRYPMLSRNEWRRCCELWNWETMWFYEVWPKI